MNRGAELTMLRRTLVTCCALSVALPAFAADPKPGREFTATAVVDTPQGTRRMPVTLVVDRFTSLDEAEGLRTLLENGGQGALLGALRDRADGRLALGALQMPLALVVAQPVDRGFEYLFLTPRTIRVGETERGSESLGFPFGIAVFELGDFGKGEGRLHVAAALSIDDEGHVEVSDWERAPGRLLDIRRVR